jgi:hypothetical protein
MSGFEAGQLIAGGASLNNALGGGFYALQSGSGAQVDAVSSPVRSGTYAMRIHPASSGSNNYAAVQQPWGRALGPILVLHFAVRFDALPGVDSNVMEVRTGFSGAWTYPQLFLWYRASTGKWAVSMGSSLTGLYQQYQEGSISAVAGTWHSFDIRWNSAANPPTPRAVEWYVDNVSQPTLSVNDGTATPGVAGPGIYFGQNDITGSAYTAYYDDVMISSTSSNYPLGDVNIVPLRPNAIHADPLGYLTNFQDNDSTAVDAASWQRVDEIPMTSTTDWMKQITSSAGGYVGIDFQDTTETCIRGASVVAGMKAQSGAPSAALGTNMLGPATGANNTVWSSASGPALTTTLAYAQGVFTTSCCPSVPGVGPWTQAGVNGAWALFGYCTNATSTRRPEIHSAILELAYRPMTGGPATVTIIGTGGASTVTTDYTDVGAGVPTLDTWTVTK